MEVQQVVIDTLAERALGVLSQNVVQVAALLFAASILAMLWTGHRKAEFLALLGDHALEDPKVRWRLRSFGLMVGSAAAFVLLLVFMPPLLAADSALWLRALVRVAVAVTLAPFAGLAVHPFWKFYAMVLAPLLVLVFKGVLDRLATWSAQRKARARVSAEGDVDLKAEPTAEDPNPKTEFLGGNGRGPAPGD